MTNSRLAFLTRPVATNNVDLKHVRAINRIIASRGNFANDYRANALKERVSEEFRAMGANRSY